MRPAETSMTGATGDSAWGAVAGRRVGGAERAHRAGGTAGPPRRAPGGAEVHEGLVEVVTAARRHEPLGQIPQRLVAAGAAARSEKDPAEHAADVGVEHGHVTAER